MKSHSTYVKVRYAETDQMGVVYHGNYAQYLEIARIDWLSAIGISYRKMEEDGIMLPVYDLKLQFLKSATFDDELEIRTTLVEQPGVRIRFVYEILNSNGELLTTAETTLIFMDIERKRPVRCPKYLLSILGY